MCGISCIIEYSKICSKYSVERQSDTEGLLKRRGPNKIGSKILNTSNAIITFSGHVLWQQGQQPCVQPLFRDGHVFLMNGDIYSQRENSCESDTQWLFDRILECQNDEDFLALFRRIEGPYSIIYFNSSTNSLYFMRDSLGRHSLLLGNTNGSLVISSVSSIAPLDVFYFSELPPLGIYKMFLNHENLEPQVCLYPWQRIQTHELYISQLNQLSNFANITSTQEPISPSWLKMTKEIPLNNQFNFETLLSGKDFKNYKDTFSFLLHHDTIATVCNQLIDLLSSSVKSRCVNTLPSCKTCISLTDVDCTHCCVGILFSGGLDCTLLAALADRYIDKRRPIDLINVAFEKQIRNNAGTQITGGPEKYECPDRISARSSLEELKTLCPDRNWKLVEVNITRTELETALKDVIAELVYPLCTVLDESLGAALWFAARGHSTFPDSYSTPSRVLLLGSGADELFGGYTRHLNAFRRSQGSWEMLIQEMELDWVRLPSRNLARDDRVIGDHGVTARSPYIEENFVQFTRSLEMWQKCYHSLGQGVGDKLILRLCAYSMGLENVCAMPKRALQFGSRVANSKQNAKDTSKSLVLQKCNET